jgi:hypothetical protein
MAEEETTNKSNITQNFNAGQTGLNMDNTLGQIKKGTLTYALNANVENFDSNSVNYQNEEGNVLCSDEENVFFPDNFILIGTHFINEQNKHIFFLVNPSDPGGPKSEIGYMVNTDCVYRTIVSSTQNDCLNFDQNYPIHKVVHRITNCSTEIYWTDGLNHRRWMNIDDVPWKQHLDPLNDCSYIDDIPLMLDCNKILVQPDITIPQLQVVDITNGGNLVAGTYQFAIQYANVNGFGFTSYYSVTNPTPIADTIVTSPDFNYPVNKSIRLQISNLDISSTYTYYNLAVIKTINAISSVELIGTYFIDGTSRTVTYNGQNQEQIRLSTADIFEKFPFYEIAQDVTSVQDILIWDNITSLSRINYQKIANQIDLQWESYRIPATENYADEINATTLRGYFRDEVYALEICFLLANGKQTDGFHIPGRAPIQYDIDPIARNDDFIVEGLTAPRWEIYNTAPAATTEIAYSSLTAPEKITYKGIYQYGDFAYWQSDEEYPCDEYVWGDLAGTNIRHHKFPDVLVSAAFESSTVGYGPSGPITPVMQDSNAVFPIGIRLDATQLETLIQASDLTQAEKDNIIGFKILRGDRTTNKSIVGKGILRNVGKYRRDGSSTYNTDPLTSIDTATTYLYPNYPYNDLTEDPFLLEDNNAYNAQCISWDLQVTVAGTVQYTDCLTGELRTEFWNQDLGGSTYCSITKPLAITATLVGITSQATNPFLQGLLNYVIVSTGVTVINYYNQNIPLTPPSTLTTVANQIYYVDSAATPFYVSGEKNISIGINQNARNNFCYPTNLKGFDSDDSKYRYVFNSPETSFGSPTLGNVLKIENAIFGAGQAHFVEVLNNAEYKLLTRQTQTIALQASFTAAMATGTFDATAMFTMYQAYLQIYVTGSTSQNFAYSFNSIAKYNYSASVPNNIGIKQRLLDRYQYVIPGVQAVGDLYDLNNFQRESSVYLRTDLAIAPLPFVDKTDSLAPAGVSRITDRSRYTPTQRLLCGVPETLEKITVLSYYGSIKNIIPNQWGQIYSYTTIDTGFQMVRGSGFSGTQYIFGGDVFICKFAFKTKLPFFIDNRVGAPNDSDVEYDQLGNVAYPTYWHSSRSELSTFRPVGATPANTFPNIVSVKAHNFDCAVENPSLIVFGITTTTTTTTLAPGDTVASNTNATYTGKMYMFAYGIPSYYCESIINNDLRQAINNLEGDYYPHVSSGIPDRWLQQTVVPIDFDNTYYYNTTFSKQNTENFFSHLPADWTPDLCKTNFPFRAIYSEPSDPDPTNKANNWLTYRATSYFDFPQSYGDLVSLDGIQNKAVLARFINKSLLYNTMLTINTSNPQAAYMGNDSLFRSAPPIDFAETDLGYVGSQNKFLLKIPQGQITVDAKRGQIFLISGNQAVDITAFGSGVNRFMTDHLAFEILRYFPEADVDNNYTKIGLTGVFDSKYDRIIISKLDYIPLPQWVPTMTYNTTTKEYYVDGEIVQLLDSKYFCNKSWTISFNMNTKSWVSFHSYIPNYYIGENNFFYSGLNQGCDLDFVAAEEVITCEPLTGTALVYTTTTTSSTSSTTTTTTTVSVNCTLAGNASTP